MAIDMSVYFEVVKEIQEQVNRITYSSQYSQQERLDLLERLQTDFVQKLNWAKRSVSYSQDYIAKPVSQDLSLSQ